MTLYDLVNTVCIFFCLFPEEHGFCHRITPRMQVFFFFCCAVKLSCSGTRRKEHTVFTDISGKPAVPVFTGTRVRQLYPRCHHLHIRGLVTYNLTLAFYITFLFCSWHRDSFKSRDSSVRIATRLRTGHSRVRIPAGKRLFSALIVHTGSGSHPTYYWMDT